VTLLLKTCGAAAVTKSHWDPQWPTSVDFCLTRPYLSKASDRVRPQRHPGWNWALAFWFFAMVLMGLFGASTSHASTPTSSMVVSQNPLGPIIEFKEGDYVFSPNRLPPASGWAKSKTPLIYRWTDVDWRTGDLHTLWGRFRFDRSTLGTEPFAVFSVSSRNQITIYVNGVEIFRNFANDSDDKLSWYRPFLAPVPVDALKPGMNEIEIRAVSRDSVGIGRVLIGPHAAVEGYYNTQFFWRITANMAANAAMLGLGGFSLILWFNRRQETELLHLASTSAWFFLRHFQYFGEDTPFELAWFNGLSVSATIFSSVAVFGFYASFLKMPHRHLITATIFALSIPLALVHWYFRLSNFYLYIPSMLIGLSLPILGLLNLAKSYAHSKLVMLIAVSTMVGLGGYDALRNSAGYVWSGNDYYLAVFNGFILCTAFLGTFAARALAAFTDLAKANSTLEQRVSETRAELMISEAARQGLMVTEAIASERGRMMQEMHDGIGSNLITALAIAEKQDVPASTLKTLRRAISDLKITVDSLEPVEGDIVALIGNLRHRMAADLRDAGITSKWEVQPCGSLSWLDATNALHVLRIFQEAISNAVAHSGATEIRIGCRDAERDGVRGIATFVADNGHGFEASRLNIPGKGLSNMQSRARSLYGRLELDSAPDAGTVMTLWLPYDRSRPETSTKT